jgi:hypothetical protein
LSGFVGAGLASPEPVRLECPAKDKGVDLNFTFRDFSTSGRH